MTGVRVGQMTVLRVADNYKKGYGVMWLCQCDCGETPTIRGGTLRSGKVVSCGHHQRLGGKLHIKHGKSQTKLYRVWVSMLKRCRDKNMKRYGGRGITVCPEWHDFSAFDKWAAQAGYREGLSIERVDNDGSYSPENCAWVTMLVQAANTRCVIRAPDGRLWSHIAREHGINLGTYQFRVKTGWDRLAAATTPTDLRFRPKSAP